QTNSDFDRQRGRPRAALPVKFRRESVFAMYTHFAVSLASGNLELDAFHHYIAQDFHFLKAFTQA
ncbi:hypothetical protein ACP6M2_13845, partial [Corynebacterium striatum]